MIDALQRRYGSLKDDLIATSSDIEQRDMRSFNRWFYRGGGLFYIVVIMVVTTLVAWVASRLPWNLSFAEAALLFNGIVLMLIWSGLTAWLGYRKFTGNLFRLVIIGPLLALAGAFVGAIVAGFAKGVDPFAWLNDSATFRHVVTAGLVFGVLYALVVALIAHLRNREYAALTTSLEAQAAQSALSRQLAESKLKMLQMQIEPHFLFNTLGSAQQLAERGAPDAARLLRDLIKFLRAATLTLRDEGATLQQEAGMIEAYLRIMQTRLSARLEWSVDIPAELREHAVPPGLLITLVENAIKHGIETVADGGRIDVRAARVACNDNACIELTVADTGAGMSANATVGGIGLANIRERLALLYGADATLELMENEPHGFIARVVLPIDRATSRHAADAAALEQALVP
jgi:signal transduction histidine kinase